MMNLDLKWLLPAALPFGFLFMFRALVWCAGLDWTEKTAGMSLMFSCIFGFALGCGLAATMMENKTRLTLRGIVHNAR